MKKYVEIITLLVSNKDDRNSIIDRLIEIEGDSSLYEDTFFRMPDDNQDITWLAMVNLLIEKGYAFEIDWKENYSVAKSGIENLLSKWDISNRYQDNNNLYDEYADQFFPKVNAILKELNYTILCLDINSDSYVTVMIPTANEQYFSSLDSRIKKY
jgi:hypothetical protein